MKIFIIVTAVIAVLYSCNSGNSKVADENAKQVDLVTLKSSAAELENETVKVTGMVSHVCKHGGQKMFLTTDASDVSLLVLVSTSIPEFDVSLEGSNVEVTGKLVVSVVNDEGTHEGDNHEGEEHLTAQMEQAEDCPTEQALKAAGEGEECTTNISYHIEATSCKEII